VWRFDFAIPRFAVLVNGGSISSEWIRYHVPAVIEAFYPGELGGDAIVNTLLGDNSPGGPVWIVRLLHVLT
jgi:beta-glucosidase